MNTTLDSLSLTQRMVAWRVAQGMTDKEIAAEMGISLQTVKNRLYDARIKIGRQANSRVEMALWVWEQQGRLGPEPDEFAP